MGEPSIWQQELRRVLCSRTFARAARLRALLAWLVEQVETGRPERLNEYDAALFLKHRPDHDPAVQSDIRKLMSRLRRKLREYYTREAPPGHVQLQLPGGFEPRLAMLSSETRDGPRAPSVPVLEFAGIQVLGEADRELVQFFEAELLYAVGATGHVRIAMQEGAGSTVLLRGRAWGARPLTVVVQLIETRGGILMAQTRVELRSRPDRAAQQVVRRLGLSTLLASLWPEIAAERGAPD